MKSTEGAEWLLAAHHQSFPRMREIRVDEGYKQGLDEWMQQNTTIRLNSIEKLPGQTGCAVIPKGERSFSRPVSGGCTSVEIGSTIVQKGETTMKVSQEATKRPLLFRYLESESISNKSRTASPERGGESFPREEEPRPEPSKKTPWGDWLNIPPLTGILRGPKAYSKNRCISLPVA